MAKFRLSTMRPQPSKRSSAPPTPLRPDYSNSDIFVGLPADLPSGHSRFPIEPAAGYGDLSFDAAVMQNAAAEGSPARSDAEQQRAWRRAMRLAIGNLVAVRLSDDMRD